MWDTFVLNQSSKFELYILGPLCCSVALTIMVKNNLSGALTVFGDYKLSVYDSTRLVLFLSDSRISPKFKESMQFLSTTQWDSTCDWHLVEGDSWNPPWSSQLCFDPSRAGLLVSRIIFVMRIAFCSRTRVHKRFVGPIGSPPSDPQKVRKTLFMPVDNLKRKHVGHICSESII